MSASPVGAAIARAWQSRWLTAAFLLLYGALVGRGLWLGHSELHDVDAQVRVRLPFVRTLTREVTVTGRAPLLAGREGRGMPLVGPAELQVRCRDAASARLRLQVEWDGAEAGAALQLLDRATGAVHRIDDLTAQRCTVTVPLPRATTTLQLLPTVPYLTMRIRGVELVAQAAPAPFAVEPHWEVVHQDAGGAIACGAGFWPRPKPGARLSTRRWAFLRIDRLQPGPHVLRLAFHRADPDARLPILTLGGRRIWSPAEGVMDWSRAFALDGLNVVELQLELGASNVLGVECAGPLLSPWEHGIGEDLRRVAYHFELDRCELRPVR